jgi:uncharacterized protein (TIGR02246 family)
MTNHGCLPYITLAILATAGTIGLQVRPAAVAGQEEKKAEAPEIAEVRKTAEGFGDAFNKGDAKAVAAFWTKDGEYVAPDGTTLRGREAIEKDYAEFFKEYPKATLEVRIDSIRLLSRYTALEEGTLKVDLPGGGDPGTSRYSVLHVRDDDGWRMASVREWVPDPSELITLKDIEWLLGDWEAKSEAAVARVTYAWDEDKAFYRGRYTLKEGDKVISAGTQIIGKDPAGGLRSWQFDSNGSFGESTWDRDGKGWVISAAGTLPDGNEVSATNLLIPLGKDGFTWQSIDRAVAGSPLPDVAPVKVTRMPSAK